MKLGGFNDLYDEDDEDEDEFSDNDEAPPPAAEPKEKSGGAVKFAEGTSDGTEEKERVPGMCVAACAATAVLACRTPLPGLSGNVKGGTPPFFGVMIPAFLKVPVHNCPVSSRDAVCEARGRFQRLI